MSDVEQPAVAGSPTKLYLFVGAICLAALLGTAASWLLFGGPRNLAALFACVALGLLSQAIRSLDVAGRKVDLSFLSIIQLASVPAVGPAGSALVGLVAHGLDPRFARPLNRVFNASMMALTGVLGGAGYLLVGGTLDMSTTGVLPLLLHLALPLVVTDVVQMLVNAACMAGVIHFDTGRPFRSQFLSMISSTGAAYLGYGAIGFLFVVLWFPAHVGPFSAVLILAPLLVARWIIAQYAEEVRSHESALSGLVTAAEIKDPASVGHSERVARLVESLAEALGLPAAETAELRVAAQLHDVGKVGVATKDVRRTDATSAEALRELAQHSVRGAELLGEMAFVGRSLAAIRHHHERWDGRGYPDGLSGEQVPMGARIIAVADAFDALTTERPSHPAASSSQALEIVSARSGSQFDPRVVTALAQVLARREWAPTVPTDDEQLMMRGYLDHDLPETSDLIAEVLHPRPVHLGTGELRRGAS